MIVSRMKRLGTTRTIAGRRGHLGLRYRAVVDRVTELNTKLKFELIMTARCPAKSMVPERVGRGTSTGLYFHMRSNMTSEIMLSTRNTRTLPRVGNHTVCRATSGERVLRAPLVAPRVVRSAVRPRVIVGKRHIRRAAVRPEQASAIAFRRI